MSCGVCPRPRHEHAHGNGSGRRLHAPESTDHRGGVGLRCRPRRRRMRVRFQLVGCQQLGQERRDVDALQRPARGPRERDGRRASPRRPASRSRCATAATSSWPTRSCRRATRSPADVFLTENSPAMTLVDSNDGFAHDRRRDARAGARAVPARRTTHWVGFAARADRPRLQHRRRCSRAELPASIMDLADPKWKGKVGYSPTGADFQAIVSAVAGAQGRERDRRRGSTGLKANGDGLPGQQSR